MYLAMDTTVEPDGGGGRFALFLFFLRAIISVSGLTLAGYAAIKWWKRREKMEKRLNTGRHLLNLSDEEVVILNFNVC